ncbi:hypothetical protein BDI4_360053 [Burkholderia diffusa]|nr:hypothetical protein BDI4_360053 [Burkholderia diffusa]
MPRPAHFPLESSDKISHDRDGDRHIAAGTERAWDVRHGIM